MENTTVYVVNKETNPKTYMFAGRRYLLKPDEKVPVPFEAASLWFGDPRAAQDIISVRDPDTDVVSWVPDRDSEMRRLTVRYGGDGNTRFPEVEVQDLDGNVLHSVLEDPEGEYVLPTVTTLSESAQKDRKIANLEERLERMEAMLSGRMADATGDIKGSDAEDTGVDLANDETITVEASGDASAADVPEADEAGPVKGKGKPLR